MIRVEQACKAFGDLTVLSGVVLHIAKGEFVAVMGKSGSGKSTLINIIGGLEKMDSGKVFIDGTDISTLNDNQLARLRNTTTGYIFQSFHLEPTYSVFKNIEVPLLIAKMPKQERINRINEVLSQVDLLDKIHQKTSVLSGGEKQRVAIARALANHPKIILADEPTGNLDSASGRAVIGQLKRLAGEGISVLLVTHSSEDAAVADRIVHMKDGRISC